MFTAKDWIILTLGLFGGVVGSVLAGFLTPAISGLISTRKSKSLHKRKMQEWQQYTRVKNFKEGKQDKYVYYLLEAIASIWCAIVAATLALAVAQAETVAGTQIALPMAIGLLAAVMFTLVAVVLAISIQTTESNLRNFEEYEKQVREKWGLPDG
jgi:hypothetical protein